MKKVPIIVALILLLVLGLSLYFYFPVNSDGQKSFEEKSNVISKGQISCPDNSQQGTICYELLISCEGIPERKVVIRQYSKDNSKASIILGVGGYGKNFYTNFGQNAEKIIKELYNNDYEIFEYAWRGNQGWGTNAKGFGYKRAMCGYSEMLKWINENLADETNNLCVSGNSGGSLQIAYGLKYHGIQDHVKMAILSGGPPTADLKLGIYDSSSKAYWPDGANGLAITDYLMGDTWLENKYAQNRDISRVPQTELDKLDNESLVGSDKQKYSFDTKINFVESNDETNADDQARLFFEQITNNKKWFQLETITEHRVPSTKEGARQITELFLSECN